MKKIPEIKRPRAEGRPIRSVSELLSWEIDLRRDLLIHAGAEKPEVSEIWYRGVASASYELLPSIYRKSVTDWASSTPNRIWLDGFGDLPDGLRDDETTKREWRRLNYERELMAAFERDCGPLMTHDDEQELYFGARHHLIPSRLLDWSVNPLVALFMATFDEGRRSMQSRGRQAIIYAMEPVSHLGVAQLFNQYDNNVESAIEIVTKYNNPFEDSDADDGDEAERRSNRAVAVKAYTPIIFPIRPHTRVGRIERQGSRFTFHSYGSAPVPLEKRNSLRGRPVSGRAKDKKEMQEQLSRLNINQFTVYGTLDRLVQEITQKFGYGIGMTRKRHSR